MNKDTKEAYNTIRISKGAGNTYLTASKITRDPKEKKELEEKGFFAKLTGFLFRKRKPVEVEQESTAFRDRVNHQRFQAELAGKLQKVR